MTERFKLDELYHMTAYIYSEQNSQRPLSATFSHFVEVCGTLTMQVRKKKREEGSFESALCRALGWFFPLVAKCRIASIEEVVFQKFPYVCPYCRLAPHRDASCKRVKGTAGTVDHSAVRDIATRNAAKKPATLSGWMKMFQEIYPRNLDDVTRSTIGLMEELGELAEAVRVFERHPKYLVGELADVFSYLMGLANEYSLSKEADSQGEFNFEHEYLARYPGICLACGNRVCTCPSVPAATVGRMAKELDIDSKSLFVESQEIIWEKGNEAARDVLAHVGGVQNLISKVPLDRGDANRSLIMICMAVANSVDGTRPDIANNLRAAALKIGAAKTEAGSRVHSSEIHSLVVSIRKIIDELPVDLQDLIRPLHESVTSDVSRMMQLKRILIAVACPSDQERIEVNREIKIATESVKLGAGRERLELEIVPEATLNDIRRRLLDKDYHVVHLAGHGSKGAIMVSGENGESQLLELSALRNLIERHHSIECVFINACCSLEDMGEAISPLTIGMEADVGDLAALEFTRGFYDGLSAGKDYEFSIEEGKSAAEMKGLLGDLPLKVVRRE